MTLRCLQGCHKSFSRWYSANTVVYIAVVIIVISLQVDYRPFAHLGLLYIHSLIREFDFGD